MSEIWVLFLIVFVATSVIVLVRHALGRNDLGRVRTGSVSHAPTASIPRLPTRVLFWIWFTGFFAGVLATERIAASMLPVHAQDQVRSLSLLLNATWWLVWGVVPAAFIRSLGSQRFDAFKAGVAYHTRHSFLSSVIVWLIAIGVLAGLGVWGLAD